MNHHNVVEGAEELSLHFTVLTTDTDYCTCTTSRSKKPQYHVIFRWVGMTDYISGFQTSHFSAICSSPAGCAAMKSGTDFHDPLKRDPGC